LFHLPNYQSHQPPATVVIISLMPTSPDSQFQRMRDGARDIFQKALSEAGISKAFMRRVECDHGVLRICDDLYDLHSYHRVFVVSIGKAGHTMVQALEARTGSHLEGIVVVLTSLKRRYADFATFSADTPPQILNRCAQRRRSSSRFLPRTHLRW